VSEAPTSKQVSKKKTLKLGEEKANKSKKKQKKKVLRLQYKTSENLRGREVPKELRAWVVRRKGKERKKEKQLQRGSIKVVVFHLRAPRRAPTYSTPLNLPFHKKRSSCDHAAIRPAHNNCLFSSLHLLHKMNKVNRKMHQEGGSVLSKFDLKFYLECSRGSAWSCCIVAISGKFLFLLSWFENLK
jgi:hypothetical protein